VLSRPTYHWPPANVDTKCHTGGTGRQPWHVNFPMMPTSNRITSSLNESEDRGPGKIYGNTILNNVGPT
jgi:hypothetical protein